MDSESKNSQAFGMVVRHDVLLALLDEVGKHRALADHETDLIEDIISAGHVPFRWSPAIDAELLEASRHDGGIGRFARRCGITGGMAYARLYRIRRRQGAPLLKGPNAPIPLHISKR